MAVDETPKTDAPYSVLLPCTPETFAEFVSSLLGSPQTIERRFLGAFDIDRADVENLYHLLQQRILQQNRASLIEFSVDIMYDDASSVRLTSVHDFQHYSEVRPLVSIGVHLTWVYLIQFQDKGAPEKQQVDVTFHAGHRYDPDEGLPFQPRFRGGHIMFRVAHTARTWGVDVESLLAGHIASLLKTESRAKTFVVKHSGKIGLSGGAIAYLIVVTGAFLGTQRFAASQLEKVRAATALGVSQKIDFLTARYAEGSWTQFNLLLTIFLLTAFVGAIALGIWVGFSAENRPESFVLLSRKAEQARAVALKSRKRQWVMFGASLLSSVAAGLMANAAFGWLTGTLK